jgi:hypothetical protein
MAGLIRIERRPTRLCLDRPIYCRWLDDLIVHPQVDAGTISYDSARTDPRATWSMPPIDRLVSRGQNQAESFSKATPESVELRKTTISV